MAHSYDHSKYYVNLEILKIFIVSLSLVQQKSPKIYQTYNVWTIPRGFFHCSQLNLDDAFFFNVFSNDISIIILKACHINISCVGFLIS